MHLVGWFIWIYDDTRTYKPLGMFWRKSLGPVRNQTTIAGEKWSEESVLNIELIEKMN